MQIHMFHIPVTALETDFEHINRFLASHKIVSVDKRFVDAGENSFWSLLVSYTTEQAAKLPAATATKWRWYIALVVLHKRSQTPSTSRGW